MNLLPNPWEDEHGDPLPGSDIGDALCVNGVHRADGRCHPGAQAVAHHPRAGQPGGVDPEDRPEFRVARLNTSAERAAIVTVEMNRAMRAAAQAMNELFGALRNPITYPTSKKRGNRRA